MYNNLFIRFTIVFLLSHEIAFMKLLPYIFGILFLFTLISACKKEDEDKDSSATNQSEIIKGNIEAIVKNGLWEVERFVDAGTNETAQFGNYKFNFEEGGSIKASNQSSNYSGVWIITDSGSAADNVNDLDFNLTFSQPPFFSDLNNDWAIVSYASSRLSFVHDNDTGPNDSLIFVR